MRGEQFFGGHFLDERTIDLLMFFADRLKVYLPEKGARHDLVDSVFALQDQDDLVLIVRRIDALGKFLDTEDGKNLLASYRRATNIIRIEEKRDNKRYTDPINTALLHGRFEKHVWSTIQSTLSEAKDQIAREHFEDAMEALSTLRPAVDAFFEKVTVNVDDKQVRENRLKLLNEIRKVMHAVADFSRIEG
jgi:glycyl-tRNA synthetase beta chain